MFLCAFGIVEATRIASGHALARQTEASVAAPAVVDAVAVRPAASGPNLTLPGETHAWYESTIYARVTGYVAKWNVDIGDHFLVRRISFRARSLLVGLKVFFPLHRTAP